MNPERIYTVCRLCPHRCGVDRTRGALGRCGESSLLRIAAIEAHMGEEPPISGSNGSCMIFFSGCSLGCVFCQNDQISRLHLGKPATPQQVVDRVSHLYETRGVHNIHFVTPDHFLPHVMEMITLLRKRQIPIPTVLNLSGYQHIEPLRLLEGFTDIYLPDFKYSDRDLAQRLSRCPDYPSAALTAVAEMVRQRGFLDTFDGLEPSESEFPPKTIARRGVLVRHLVLPGQLKNSIDALTMLFLEFGRDLPISLMAQYTPTTRTPKDPVLGRTVSQGEFDTILEHALSLGLSHLFVQQPCESLDRQDRDFLPDFSQIHPFAGNPRV